MEGARERGWGEEETRGESIVVSSLYLLLENV